MFVAWFFNIEKVDEGYSIGWDTWIIILWKVLVEDVLYHTSKLKVPVSSAIPYQEFQFIEDKNGIGKEIFTDTTSASNALG